MPLKRSGNALLNTDTEAYLAAKKRLSSQRERKKKDLLLEQLSLKVSSLEREIKLLEEKMEALVNDLRLAESILKGHDE